MRAGGEISSYFGLTVEFLSKTPTSNTGPLGGFVRNPAREQMFLLLEIWIAVTRIIFIFAPELRKDQKLSFDLFHDGKSETLAAEKASSLS